MWRFGPGTQVTGNLPNGPVIILRWDSIEALQNWRNSPTSRRRFKVGEKYAQFNIIARAWGELGRRYLWRCRGRPRVTIE